MMSQISLMSQNIIVKDENVSGITLSDFKVIVIKTTKYVHTNQRRKQWNTMKSSEINESI